jgi:hypothetical protein
MRRATLRGAAAWVRLVQPAQQVLQVLQVLRVLRVLRVRQALPVLEARAPAAESIA